MDIRCDEKQSASMEAGLLGLMAGDSAAIPFSSNMQRMTKSMDCTDRGNRDIDPFWGQATALTLATMETIQSAGGGIDYEQIMSRFLSWLQGTAYRAPGQGTDRYSIDVSVTTEYSILRYKNGRAPLLCGALDSMSNGAAPLTRMLPIAYYRWARELPFPETADLVNHMCSLTQSHEISWLGCLIFTDYVGFLLEGCDNVDAARRLQERPYSTYYTAETCDEYRRILSGEIVSLDRSDIHTAAYMVSVLEASLWCILHTENYRDAIDEAIALSRLPEYTCAVTGCLAGLLYGKEGIPIDLLRKIPSHPYLEDAITRFLWSLQDESTAM